MLKEVTQHCFSTPFLFRVLRRFTLNAASNTKNPFNPSYLWSGGMDIFMQVSFKCYIKYWLFPLSHLFHFLFLSNQIVNINFLSPSSFTYSVTYPILKISFISTNCFQSSFQTNWKWKNTSEFSSLPTTVDKHNWFLSERVYHQKSV